MLIHKYSHFIFQLDSEEFVEFSCGKNVVLTGRTCVCFDFFLKNIVGGHRIIIKINCPEISQSC